MNGAGARLVGLCLPPLALCALDASLTLVGQSDRYWSGDFASVNETSPTFHHLLTWHPLMFAAGIGVWALVFVGLIALLPGTPALIVSITVTFGHAVGAATWLLFRFEYGYQACNALFLLSAIVLGLGIRLGAPPPPDHLRHWHPLLRWGLAAALFGVGVYLFVWPRTP